MKWKLVKVLIQELVISWSFKSCLLHRVTSEKWKVQRTKMKADKRSLTWTDEADYRCNAFTSVIIMMIVKLHVKLNLNFHPSSYQYLRTHMHTHTHAHTHTRMHTHTHTHRATSTLSPSLNFASTFLFNESNLVSEAFLTLKKCGQSTFSPRRITWCSVVIYLSVTLCICYVTMCVGLFRLWGQAMGTSPLPVGNGQVCVKRERVAFAGCCEATSVTLTGCVALETYRMLTTARLSVI